MVGFKCSTLINLPFYNGANTFITRIDGANATQTYTIRLPPTAPTISGQVLSSTTGGICSWANSSVPAGGSTTQIQFNNSGSFDGSASLTWDGINLNATQLDIGGGAMSGNSSGVITGSSLRLSQWVIIWYINSKSSCHCKFVRLLLYPSATGTTGQMLVLWCAVHMDNC